MTTKTVICDNCKDELLIEHAIIKYDDLHYCVLCNEVIILNNEIKDIDIELAKLDTLDSKFRLKRTQKNNRLKELTKTKS